MSRHAPRLLALALAGALAPLAGCGGGGAAGPSWAGLAVEATPVDAGGTELRTRDGTLCRVVRRAAGDVLEIALEARHWHADSGGLWRAPSAFVAPADGHGLTAGTRRFEEWTGAGRQPPGSFRLERNEVVLRLAGDERPPESTTLALALRDPGRAEPGRVRGRRFSGAGFPVLPGLPVEVVRDVPAGRALSFATAVDGLLLGATLVPPEVVFRVELDGESVFERTVAAGPPALERHRVVLPGSGGRLRFSVEGAPAYTAFLDPVLGPAEIGTPGNRPWEERPDVVVFLADTFRADNMAFHGGTHELTPNLDRFARASLAFRDAWSTGTFTLSAHATMFTGVYPHQAGILGEAHALPEEFETLAELLSAHGYRTGAITDSGIVSQAYALDQGFGTFDEGRRELEQAVEDARAFLDADDGRPVFLFLQTYRVHRPFRVSARTLAEHGARLGIEGDFNALEEELVALARSSGHADVARAHDAPPEVLATPEAERVLRALEAHYRGCVIDLDRTFEVFRAALEQRGLLARGNLIFTSDHGEAFGEHGQLYHKDDVFEEQTRIPLIVAGHGVTPGVSGTPASLIDLAPTVAALAGVERPGHWVGRSLLSLTERRPLLSFECSGNRAQSTFALRDGTRKLIGFEEPGLIAEGELLGAFDLGADPGERDDLSGREAWPGEQLERFRPLVEHLLEPLNAANPAALDAGKVDELRALGYGGGGEE